MQEAGEGRGSELHAFRISCAKFLSLFLLHSAHVFFEKPFVTESDASSVPEHTFYCYW